jgi:hypothetical protein
MKLFIILIYFLKEEIKINLRRIKKIYMFFKTFSFFRLLLYLINNSFVPSRDKNFRNYILKNSKKWKNKNSLKNSDNKKVLITNVYDHVVYTTTEIVIGKNLMEMFNADGIALLNEYNLKQILLFKSFGINKIIILRNFNIFVRFRYFIKAYLIIKSCKNMDEFLNFNINNVEIGKAVYEHYLRHSGTGTANKFEPVFYLYLSKSLQVYDQINRYLKKYKIIASVQSEVQFIPGLIIFQHTLANGIDVYTKIRTIKVKRKTHTFGVKKYSSFNDRNKPPERFSKELYDLINKNIKEVAVRMGEEIIKKRFEGLPEYQKSVDIYEPTKFITNGNKFIKIKREDIDKEGLCKKFGWNNNSPIAVIFSPDLTDGIFQNSWSIFRDNLTWLRETLIEIKKINNVNWLVKSHPHDGVRKVITSTTSQYEKYCPNCNHIKMFPNNITMVSMPRFIDVVISFKSPASEYSCFGIPAITPCETNCTALGYTIDTKSKEEYFFQLQNIKKLKKLNNQQIESAKIFIFAQTVLTQIPSSLIVHDDGTASKRFNEENFWTEMSKLLDQYKYENDMLKKMMKIQQINNDLHTIDYRMIKKENTFNRLNGDLDDIQTELSFTP